MSTNPNAPLLALLAAAFTATSAGAESHGAMSKSKAQAPVPNLFTAVVEPGKGASCRVTPCRVYYRTPDLDVPVKVVVNNFPAGTFEPGMYADLGNYNEPGLRISVPGSEVPTAYVNITDSGNSN